MTKIKILLLTFITLFFSSAHAEPIDNFSYKNKMTVEEVINSNQTLLALGFTDEQTKISANDEEYEPYMVMGFTENEILEMAGEYKDRYSNTGSRNALACSQDHEKDDIANRWCHAGITKAISKGLIARGLNPRIAGVLAATFFIPKEYMIDKNPSTSDLVFTIEETVGKNRDSKIELTVFGDGAVFVAIKHRL